MSLSGIGKRYSATGGRNRRKNKNKKTIQKLISVANEDKKKLSNTNKILTKKTITDKTKPKKLKK